MKKKDIPQPELQLEIPTSTDLVEVADTEAKAEETPDFDDAPDVVSSDLRKFNRTKAAIAKALAPIKKIIKITSDTGVTTMMGYLKDASTVEKAIEAKRKDLVRPYNNEVDRINAHAKTLSAEIPVEITRGKKLILDYNTEKEAGAKRVRTTNRNDYMLHLGLVRFDKGTPQVLADHYHDATSGYNVYRKDLEELSEDWWVAMINALQVQRLEAATKVTGYLHQERAAAEFFGDTDQIEEIDQKIQQVQTVAPRPVFSGGSTATATKTQGLTKRWVFKTTDVAQVPREYLQVDEARVKAAIAAGTRAIPGLEIYQDQSITIR